MKTADWVGLAVGVASLIATLAFAIWEIIRRKFTEREKNALKSHLRAIDIQLNAMHSNVVETHKAEDVVKSEAGKRFLSGLAYGLVGVRNHIAVDASFEANVTFPREIRRFW